VPMAPTCAISTQALSPAAAAVVNANSMVAAASNVSAAAAPSPTAGCANSTGEVEAAAAELAGAVAAVINSSSQRTMYQRFLNRFSTRKAQRDYGQLVERFNDRSKRAELFTDYYNNNENMDQILLIHNRRHVLSQRAKAKFRPLTEEDMVVKFHGDRDYVELVKADAIQKKRWRKDALVPNDPKKYKYWILDDETMTFEQLLEIENVLSGTTELEAATAQTMINDGGYFSSNASMGMSGWGYKGRGVETCQHTLCLAE